MTYGIDTKAKKIALIINPPKTAEMFSADFFPALNNWLLETADVYAYILHDLDTNEDGEAKRPHVHVYAEMKQCRRLMTNLSSLANALGYDTMQISIEKASSNPTGFIQYLVHKNNPEKHQYAPSEIATNLDEASLKALLDSDAGNCSLSYFVSVCANERNIIRVIEKIGLDVYMKYRNAIQDIWRACH